MRFAPNPTKSTATFTTLPKTDGVVFVVGEPKAFVRDTKSGEQAGVRYQLTVAEGEHSGKRITYSGTAHDDVSFGYTKQFLMAALGYELTPEGEAQFNAVYSDPDGFAFDPENGEVGDVWREAKDKRVVCDVDVTVVGTATYQKFQNWQPYAG